MHSSLIFLILLQASVVLLFPENYYDEESMFNMAGQPSSHKYQIPNLAENSLSRYGHTSDEKYLPNRDDYEFEYDDFNAEFARPTRSQDKSDNFVRFGRGNSDFVRFGRDPYRHAQLRADQNFIRFGRTFADSEMSRKRTKRSAHSHSEQKRNGNDENFLRYGRGGDDSFVRYGRNYDSSKINGDESTAPTKSNAFDHRPLLSYPYHFKEESYNLPLLIILKKLEELKEKN